MVDLESRLNELTEVLAQSTEDSIDILFSVVSPLLQILGFNPSNPKEFKPYGKASAQHKDYVIRDSDNDKDFMLVCAKGYNTGMSKIFINSIVNNLSKSEVQYCLVTDGVLFKFMSKNDKDIAVRYEFDLRNLKACDYTNLRCFCKDTIFNMNFENLLIADNISDTLTDWFTQQSDSPSEEFVSFLQETLNLQLIPRETLIENIKQALTLSGKVKTTKKKRGGKKADTKPKTTYTGVTDVISCFDKNIDFDVFKGSKIKTIIFTHGANDDQRYMDCNSVGDIFKCFANYCINDLRIPYFDMLKLKSGKGKSALYYPSEETIRGTISKASVDKYVYGSLELWYMSAFSLDLTIAKLVSICTSNSVLADITNIEFCLFSTEDCKKYEEQANLGFNTPEMALAYIQKHNKNK